MAAEALRATNQMRIGSAAAVALLHGLLVYAFVTGLGSQVVRSASENLRVFDVAVRPPPPPVEPPAPVHTRPERDEGAAAPAGFKARPSPVVAPRMKVRVETPPPVAAAPDPGTGSDRTAGNSATPGPGPGSGGQGTGTGSGSRGDGGGSGGIATRARLLSGRIADRDYPRGAYRARSGGTVVAHLSVGADGRVERCAVTRSSGNPELDATTCRLIEQRFRYEPARDASGRPLPSVTGWRQVWWLEPPRGSGD